MIGKLVKSEFTLNWRWFNYIFFVMPLVLLAPQYPTFVGMLYFFFIITSLFPSFAANKDFAFWAMLPVSRRQIVAVKLIDVLVAQWGTLLLAAPLLAIRYILYPQGDVLMDGNMTFVGMTLIVYGVFLLAFLPTYFRKLSAPKAQILSIFVYLATVGLLEGIMSIPVLNGIFDGFAPANRLWQGLFMAFGAVLYALSVWGAYRLAVRNFSRYNL